MVFNWFRRQFSDRSEAPQEEEKNQPPEPPAEKAVESAPEPDVAADYLSWAKAAYKNIQERQQAETVEAAAEPEVEAKPEVEAVELSTAKEAVTEAEQVLEPEVIAPSEEPEANPESVLAEAEVKAEEPTPEPVLATTEAEEPVAEPTTEVKIPEAVALTIEPEAPELEAKEEPIPAITEVSATVSETVEPSAPLPFWARDDRQERLERLKATAIEPEPVTTPPAAASTAEETIVPVPGLEFDEGFLWSAEVLAAQGRKPEDVSFAEISWLKRLRQGLDKTRRSLINQLKSIVGQGPLNQDAVGEIETLLLQADVGVEAAEQIIEKLQQRLREEVLPPEEAIAYLKQILRDMLDQPLKGNYSANFAPEKETLNIWLMTGVNGAGKTTTIGKIAHLAQQSGYKCLIGAADTFRAAAVEQVKIWGQRSGTEVIANPGKNTDPAAVVFDAIAAAQARHTELLLIDTAGRLQNKKNLMEELSKIRRVVDKKAPQAKVESLLVLDSTLGQNGLRQAQVFAEAAKLSGVVLTKLDGTAKGGIALAVVQQLGLPIRFIGAGEGIEDLRPFSSYEFVEALLSG
jgi:fused signal recognition particle receptor